MGEKISLRYNVMEVSSIDTFENIKGGMNHNCKDVYFVRLVGANPALVQDVAAMDEILTRRMKDGKGSYKRIHELPGSVSMEESNIYSDIYEAWKGNDKSDIRVKSFADQAAFREQLSSALEAVMRIYAGGNKAVSASMEKNFAVKQLYWTDFVLQGLMKDWEIRASVKIVANNVVKKQEYLFYYLLTLIGFDVLLLQNEKDLDAETDGLGLSKKYVLGEYRKCSFPEYAPHVQEREAPKRPPVCENEMRSVMWGSQASVQPVMCESMPSMQAAGQQPGQSVQTAMQEGNVKVRIPERRSRQDSESCKNQRQSVVSDPRMPVTAADTRGEKSFEELALLASSVVLIAIHNEKGDIIGTGSGIMVGKDGYILTNNHVTSGGRVYSVRIEDDEQVYTTDEIIKYNPVLDLAVIRINRSLKPIPVYSGSRKLVRGQKVVAIGSPLGLFNSVSDGIISGFRKINDVDMIQFTAPISHGSSGGAVLNMYGEVVGISTAGMDEGQNINLAVGYEFINTFIKGFV